MVSCLAIVLIPVVWHNQVEYDEWSISTSRRGAWSLLVGTNQKYSGRYNAEDVETTGGRGVDGSAAAAAQAEAMRRITSDPVGFSGLAVRKLFSFAASGGLPRLDRAPDSVSTDPERDCTRVAGRLRRDLRASPAVTGWRARKDPFVFLSLGIMRSAGPRPRLPRGLPAVSRLDRSAPVRDGGSPGRSAPDEPQEQDAKQVEPVRSGLPYFVTGASEYRSAFTLGGDAKTLAYVPMIDGKVLYNVDALFRSRSAFRRDKTRKAPHNAMTTSTAVLSKAVADRFRFGHADGSGPADLCRR